MITLLGRLAAAWAAWRAWRDARRRIDFEEEIMRRMPPEFQTEGVLDFVRPIAAEMERLWTVLPDWSAAGLALDDTAAAFGLARAPGETDEQFRERLLACLS